MKTGAIDLLVPGADFGRYVVESRLARGGMGEVWLATARGPGDFQKRVVIKTVLPELMEKPGYVDMLVREASLAARLDHPNIVHVFDLGCVDGLYFIAMEFLSGRTLAQMLRRSHEMTQRLPLRILITMIAASCDGLQYAHDYADVDGKPLGLLHRDISPSNIMLTFAGRTALLDFGVATASAGRHQTQSGTIKGKFHYLAPERVRGEQADRRSDIYSLGVVLYQCLTLRWPFRAQNDYELLRQIAHDTPPPVRHYAPWIPGPLESIVMRAMAREPAARHEQAETLGTELREFMRSTGTLVDPNELSAYLAGLFPEAPEAATRRQTENHPVIQPEPDDGIEITFHSNDAPEAASRLFHDDRRPVTGGGLAPDEIDMATMPPRKDPPRRPDPTAPIQMPRASSRIRSIPPVVPRAFQRAQSPLATPVAPIPVAPMPVEPQAAAPLPPEPPIADTTTADVPVDPPLEAEPSFGDRALAAATAGRPERDADVDIFPEPTRSIRVDGGDVFGGYGSRSGREKTRSVPAFVPATPPTEEPGAWPWAKRIGEPRPERRTKTAGNGGRDGAS